MDVILLAVAPVLDFLHGFQHVSFRLWKRPGLGPVCCPPAAPVLGEGRDDRRGRVGGRGGGCKEKGLLSYSLLPNVSQRTSLFCSSPRGPALPAALWRILAGKTSNHGWEGERKKEKKKETTKFHFPLPLSLPRDQRL